MSQGATMQDDARASAVMDPIAPLRSPRFTTTTMGPVPLPAGTRLQEFEIQGVIGQGGFGIVYLARDVSLQRLVAIKEYMPAQLAGRRSDASVGPLLEGQLEVFELGRRSFINEARMLARFKHPGLLEVLRFWEQHGTAYMAMPYYDGSTLTQYLKRHPGTASEDWLKRTLLPLVDALGHMHAEDCFHRDVAPDNILVLKDGSAVLLDLGAARRVIADDVQAMTVMLKPGYAPIEQYSDDPRFRQGPWTDVYAMAAVFFFGITGKAPPAAATRVMRDSVSPLSEERPTGFSEGFLQAIDRGMSLQPEDRPRSIEEFRALLFARTSAAAPSAPRAPAKTAAIGALPAVTPASKAMTAAKGRRAAVSDVDDPFKPPMKDGSGAYFVAGLAALVGALGIGWFALQPSTPTKTTFGATKAAAEVPAPARSSTPLPDPTREVAASPVAPTSAGAISAALATFATETIAPEPVAPEPVATESVAPESIAPESIAPESIAPESIATESIATESAAAAAIAAEAITANPIAATPTSSPPTSSVAPTVTAAIQDSTTVAKPARPEVAKGTVILAVKPWAEVRVGGVVKGVSPPLKALTLPAGRHTIELRNPASAPVRIQVDVKANASTTVRQQF